MRLAPANSLGPRCAVRVLGLILQQQLHDLVKEKGEVPKQEAARVLGISEDELQREFAVLRHLEMLRACKKDEGIFLIPF